jgi:hypothetical protein
MVQKNYDFITGAFANIGFEDFFNKSLKTEMLLNKPNIPLKGEIMYDKETNKKIVFELDIAQGKNKDTGFYFFNGYKATLQTDGEKDITQFFHQHKQNGVHIDKALNLLEGRSAHLEFRRNGEEIGRWVKINFDKETLKGFGWITKYDKDIKFNLVEKLSEIGIVNASQSLKEKLLENLMKGQRVAVVIKQDNKTEKRFIEATPQIGKISIFDQEGNTISVANRNGMKAVPVGEIPLPDAAKAIVAGAEGKEKQKEQIQGQGKSRRA